MKNLNSDWSGKTSRVSFCSVATETQSIEIAGQVLVPNEDTAYVEFFMSHAFPVTTKYRTGIHPAVVANSYATLNHKVLNLGHLMRKYNPKQNPRDRILGTVVAVEFAPMPEGGWKLDESAPGIRAVAVMHKAAESVMEILMAWFTGENPTGGEWTVSMENSFNEEEGGFLVKTTGAQTPSLEPFMEQTPADLLALGYVYCPSMTAPMELLGCLNTAADDKRDGMTSARICRDFEGQPVIFLLGGLDGKIRYRGVGLTPANGAREGEARISQMLASQPMIDASEALSPLAEFGKTLFENK